MSARRPRPAATRRPIVERIWEVLEGVRVASASARPTPRRSRCRPTSRPGSRPTTRRLPRRGAHPRPGHVPQAADPRRRPPASASPCSASTSTPPRDDLPRRAGRRRADEPPPADPAARTTRARRRRDPGLPDARGLRHPALPGRRQGDQRGRGGPDRRRPALLRPSPTSGTAPGSRRPVVERLVLAGAFDSLYGIGSVPACAGAAGSPGATCCSRSPSSGHPARPAAARRRARAGGRGRARAAAAGRAREPAAAARAEHRAGRARPAARRARPTGVWAQAAAQSQAAARPCRPPSSSTQLTLDLGDRPRARRAATGLPEMTGPERVRAELEILGLDVSRARRRLLRPAARRARGDPQPRPARRPQPQPRCWSPGSRSPPRPRRSAPGAGWSS